MSFLLVSLGGGIGSLLRYYLSIALHKHVIGTWICNVSGSILLALLLHSYVNGSISINYWLFFGVGFCGAYTTFSTFGHETLTFIVHRNYKSAFLYVVTSYAVSLLPVLYILFRIP